MSNFKMTAPKKVVGSNVEISYGENISRQSQGTMQEGIMKSMDSVGSASMKQNQKLSENPSKLWFEILTNIPAGVKKVLIDISRVKSGFDVKITQFGDGTTLDVINENLLDEDTVNDGSFVEKKNSSSSIYGTGIYTQSLYTEKLIYKVKTLELDEWQVWDVKTRQVTSEVNDELTSGVIIEMSIPFNPRMNSYQDFVKSLRTILGVYDNRNITDGRVYNLNVSGFETGTIDSELSKPIEPVTIDWVSKTGKNLKFAEFTDLTYNKNRFTELVLELSFDGKDTMITLSNFKMGKRDGNPVGYNFDSDRPYLIVYYKGSNQIAFMLPLRSSSGMASLNHVTVECEISKSELRPFFTTVDKFAGVQDSLNRALVTKMRDYLLDRYPDNKLLEYAIQLWLYDVIVNDYGGVAIANMFRKRWNLGFLNVLSKEIREKVVHLEWDSDEGRHDFKIFITDKDGNVTADTKNVIIECKREDFNPAARQQSIGYVTTTKNTTMIIGVSRNIKPKNVEAWNKFLTKIKGSGQLSFQLDDALIDVKDWGFEEAYDTYTSLALKKSKKTK
jgi:hypothetical protein